jgi:hypothetical protein
MPLLAITAPSGWVPLVTCLATFMRSGVTPKASAPVAAPMRPKPVMTSSKISRMSCLVQMSRSRCR